MTQPVRLSVWLSVIRRARLGRTVKAVAHALATRANNDGTGLYVGIARLSVECELTPKVVKETLRELRTLGLIVCVGRRNRVSVYELALPGDGRLSIPTPDEHEASVLETAVMLRRKDGPRRGSAYPVNEDPRQGTAIPVTKESRRGTAAPLNDAVRGTAAPPRRGTAYPAYLPHTSPVTTPPTDEEEVRTAVTGSRARGPAEPQPDAATPVDALPERCPHGLAARRRPDGTSSCALCRRSSGLAPVIQLRRHGAAS